MVQALFGYKLEGEGCIAVLNKKAESKRIDSAFWSVY